MKAMKTKPKNWLPRSASRAVAAVLVAGAANPAFASGGGEENIFSGNLGNAVWTIVVFGLVLFVLGKYAWGPLLEAMQQREQFVHDSLAEAKREREEAKKQLEEHTSQLNAARAEATEIVEEGRRDSLAVKARIEEEAREESQKTLERAKREIDLAKQMAIKELYTSSATLATEMASRILQKELSPAEKDKLIARSLDELEQLDTN